jgi:hypothetical protein
MSYYDNGPSLNVVHFTHGATDPLQGFRCHGVRVVMLADGGGEYETYVSCLHFEPGGWVTDPPTQRDSAILVVHGDITLHQTRPYTMRHRLSPGVGLVMNADCAYRIESETGAILIVVEAEHLKATEFGISTPERIWGQLWPGEKPGQKPRTLLSIGKSIYYRWKWRKVRRLTRLDQSGWTSAPVEAGLTHREKPT